MSLCKRYKELAQKEKGVIFGGRLGEYKYYDMDKVIASALNIVQKNFYRYFTCYNFYSLLS